MKTCTKCYYYYNKEKMCIKFKCNISNTLLFGSVCKDYSEKQIKKVQCYDCKNLNKYKYCLMKKVCLDDIEIKRLKQCRHYFKRKRKKKT